MQNPPTNVSENISSLLTDLDKEVLNFLYRQRTRSKDGEVPIGEMMHAFAEVDEDDFGDRCTALALDDLISSRGGKSLTLSQKGLTLAQTLWGQATGLSTQIDSLPKPAASTGDDLLWDLSHAKDPRLSLRLAEFLSTSMAVYSASARALFTSYKAMPVKGQVPTLRIVPNLQDEHDTYYAVPPDSCVATRSFVCPDAGGGLRLRVLGKQGKWHVLPLREGLDLVQSKLGDTPFLPVLMHGDLREIEPGVPAMHLHRLVPGRISGQSDLELRALRRTIQHRLAERFGFKPLTGRLFA